MARLNVATWEEFKLQLVVEQLKKQLKEAENKIEDLERENSALTEEVNELHKDLDYMSREDDDFDKFLEALEKDLSEHPLNRKETDIGFDYHAILSKISTRLKKYGHYYVAYNAIHEKVIIVDYNKECKTFIIPFKDFVNDFTNTFNSLLDTLDIVR